MISSTRITHIRNVCMNVHRSANNFSNTSCSSCVVHHSRHYWQLCWPQHCILSLKDTGFEETLQNNDETYYNNTFMKCVTIKYSIYLSECPALHYQWAGALLPSCQQRTCHWVHRHCTPSPTVSEVYKSTSGWKPSTWWCHTGPVWCKVALQGGRDLIW